MLKHGSLFLVSLVLGLSASKVWSQDYTQESSLILRFSGAEAQRLTDFMKERFRRETDFDQTPYYGERMSLACREGLDCYLWLLNKEWQAEPSGLSFTLPLKQNTFSGRVTWFSNSKVQINLQDLLFPGFFSFAQPLTCTQEKSPLNPAGDCRMEVATAPKKSPAYTPSIQYIHNVSSIIVNFKGPWAQKLFKASPQQSPDPHNPQRLRTSIGPDAYCWNLDPLNEDKFLSDAYVCQAKLTGERGGAFVSEDLDRGKLKLIPSFRHQLLQDFELVVPSQGEVITVTHCPNAAKNSGFGQCGLFYDLNSDPGLYPLGNSVQGVAVGWGLIKETPDPN